MIKVNKKLGFIVVLSFLCQILFFSSAAIANSNTNLRGVALKDVTSVYSTTSSDATVLKSYQKGSILQFEDYNNNWYKATVYVNHEPHTGYIKKSDVEQSTAAQKDHRGIALKSPTKVYQKASTGAKVWKSYKSGSVLKFKSFTSQWYEATVYVGGKPRTGYIHKGDVELAQEQQSNLRGIGLKAPTKVYEKASTSTKVWKSYSAGHILQFKSFTSQWYEATVYVGGKPKTGYIHKNDVELIQGEQKELRGIALKSPTRVYQKAATSAKVWKSYSVGNILKYKTLSANWYEATVYVGGKPKTGYIHKSHVENAINDQKQLKGIGLQNKTAVYQKASTNSKKLKTYAAGKILQYKTFSSNWYEATVVLNNKPHTGYIHKRHVDELASNNGKTLKGRALKSPTKVYSGPSRNFKVLKSYKKIRILEFKILSKNWYQATVILNNKPHTGYIHVSDVTTSDVIQTTNYNVSFEEFIAIQMSHKPKADGQGRVLATRDQVIRYANPSNYRPGSKEYFQFLVLTEPAGLSVKEINNKILNNAGSLKGQGQAFVDAAKQHDINEAYLLAHALHETGNGTSPLSQGLPVDKNGNITRDSKGNIANTKDTVKTVYNMFGYGAHDGDALGGGAKYAYLQGWDSKYKAIVGGAKNINSNYLGKGQDTLYKMRWNPAYPGTHQYATHIQWATSQASRLYDIYQNLENYVLVFDVPKFSGESGTITSMPKNTYGFVKVSSTLNFRSGPSTSYLSLGGIPNGTKLEILRKHSSGWYEVIYDGKTGWVSSAYVELN